MVTVILLDMHYGNIIWMLDIYHVFGIILEKTKVSIKVPSLIITVQISHYFVVKRVIINIVK